MGKLNALAVTRAAVGMHGDGDGLWLMVTQRKDGSLSRRWVFRYRRHDRYSEIPIGPVPAIGLGAAREAANKHRAALAAGDDPAQQRRDAIEAKKAELVAAKTASNTKPLTFRLAVNEYTKAFGDKWRSARAAKAFVANLDNHVMSAIGDKLVAGIGHNDVLEIFDRLQEHSPIMASRIRAACESVFGYAIHRHRLAVMNPFAWKGNLEHVYPKKPDSEHFKAIDYKTIPALFTQLIELGDDPSALAARFQIASALRPTEARLMKFEYIDATANTFTIPVTKNGRSFTVPINEAAREVIDRARELRTSECLFAGRDSKSPIGERALYTLVNRLTGASAHGVARSCFADYCYDHLQQFSESTIEAALHHATGDSTVRAYRRGDALEPRRKLMACWSDFITGRVAVEDDNKVVAFLAKTA